MKPKLQARALQRSGRGLRIFLSYAHEDKPIARRIARALLKAGTHVWIDEGELRIGDSIIERIMNALSEMEFVVALISDHSNTSNWCRKELALAMEEGLRQGIVRVLPIRVDNAEMPPSLRDVFYLELDSRDPEPVIARLIQDARAHRRESLTKLRRFASRRYPALSLNSSLSPQQLARLRLALLSPREDIPYKAAEQLAKDRSITATEILYQDALDDALTRRNAGFAVAVLVELGPPAAPWLYRLLTHEDNRVVRDAFYAFANVPHVVTENMWNAMVDMLEALIMFGDWDKCKRRLLVAIPKGFERDDLDGVLRAAAEIQKQGKARVMRHND